VDRTAKARQATPRHVAEVLDYRRGFDAPEDAKIPFIGR
jgi:hypothetical protein